MTVYIYARVSTKEVIRLEKVSQFEERMRYYHHKEVAVETEVTR